MNKFLMIIILYFVQLKKFINKIIQIIHNLAVVLSVLILLVSYVLQFYPSEDKTGYKI